MNGNARHQSIHDDESNIYFLKLNRDGTGRTGLKTGGSGAIGVGGVGRWAPIFKDKFVY